MKSTLYVMDGRVQCPRRGDIDVDLCTTCPQLADMRSTRGETVITCRPIVRPASTLAFGPF